MELNAPTDNLYDILKAYARVEELTPEERKELEDSAACVTMDIEDGFVRVEDTRG